MRARLWLVLAACGPSAKGPPADAYIPADRTEIDAAITSVRQLRMSPPAKGTIVNLAGLVVMAHVSSKRTGSVWVQDVGGGMYSGIHVFCNFTDGTCALQQTQLDALAVGTVVNVSGTVAMYLPTSAPAGAVPELELDAPTITSTGDTRAPVAVDAAAADVAKTVLGVASDPYKGCYVHVTGASSWTASTVTASELTGTCTDQSMPPQTGMQYTGFEAAGASATLAVGLGFYDTLTYCLPCTGVPAPYPCNNPVTASQTFPKLQGIVEPDFNANGAVYLRVSPVLDGDL
jgi:hypothetical protein